MTDVLDNTVLLVEPVVHLLSDVVLVLCELVKGVALNALNLGTLAVQFRVKLVHELSLHLLALLLLLKDRVFNFLGVGREVVQDHAFVSDALVPLLVEVTSVHRDLIVDWGQLVSQVLNTVGSLLSAHVVKVLEAIVTALNLIGLVLALCSESVVQF